MKHVLLAAAALCAAAIFPTASAQAESSRGSGFASGPGSPGGAGISVHRGHGDHDGRDRRHRRDRRFDDDALGMWVDGGEWALYNNRTWLPDSYNDWWHDHPNRAFPRWFQNNQGCERKWYSADTLRC